MRSRKTAREAAEAIIRELGAAGFDALLAGGCVRDLLLGLEPQDFDVATSATPAQVCTLYPRAQEVGAHFGVVIVRKFGHFVEVATFRTDGVYKDGRHPETVEFATPEQDARRRDFTINGMFLDIRNDRVIDYVQGQQDLRDRLVQAIGNPEERFEEDHLRMLRAVRFAARLGFHIEQETFEAIYNRADKIRLISAERIREELDKILSDTNRAVGFDMLCATQLLPHLWPNAQWSTALLKTSSRALAALPPNADFSLAFAAMVHGLGKQAADRACKDLACSNRNRARVRWLIAKLDDLLAGPPRTLADLKLLMAGPCFDDLCSLFKAALIANDRPLDALQDLLTRTAAVAPEHIAPRPLINGDDLLDLGFKPGPIFKRVLDGIYYRQLNLELADREEALAVARHLSQDHAD